MKSFGPILLSAICLVLGSMTASADDKYPSRPIKVIVPYAAGGATDIVARIVGEGVQKICGQGFVVLNKPGAYGLLAIDEMAKAEPDGYTLMLGNVTTNAITPILYAKKLTINYVKDVVAVTNLVDIPAFLMVTTATIFLPRRSRSSSLTPNNIRARSNMARSVSAHIPITTWPISPSAPATSRCPLSPTGMAPLA